MVAGRFSWLQDERQCLLGMKDDTVSHIAVPGFDQVKFHCHGQCMLNGSIQDSLHPHTVEWLPCNM
jgi:hypothetical protein